MKKCFSLFFIFILALAFSAMAQENAPVPKTDAEAKPKCLSCHGPFDKLAEKTAKFKARGGETTTPHRYVPHDEKKDIPKCEECHLVPHPIPIGSKESLLKATDEWCYTSCHHVNNLLPCKGCHN